MVTSKKKVVVLGGSGFLGQHVMRLLRDNESWEAVSLARREGVDILDKNLFVEKLREHKPDAIINCIAHVGSIHYVTAHAADVIRDNMQFIVNIYDAVATARPTARVINPLANCSYPGAADIQAEPEWQNGPVHDSVLAFGTTRRMIYAFAEAYRKQHGIKSINWIVPNAYGPGDYTDPDRVHALNGILMRMIEAQRKGNTTFEIWGSGKPLREWAYIEDVARILIHSLTLEEQVYPINFAQNKAYSITEIAELGRKALGYNVTFTYNTAKPDGAPIKMLSDKIFREAYPDFIFTPLDTGIDATIAYYQKVL